MLLLSMVFAYFRAQSFLQEQTQKEQELASLYTERIQRVVHEIVNDGHVVQEVLELFPHSLTEKRFEEIARIVFKSQYYIFISYQPKGIVQYIYPQEAFGWIRGTDILEDEHTREDALYAKNSGRTVLTGPYRNGNLEAIVLRRPVYEFVNDKQLFWGFISVGFDVKKLLRDVIEIDSLTNFNYKFGLYTFYKGNRIEILQSENFERREENKMVFTVGDQVWTLYLYDAGRNKALMLTLMIFLIVYFAVSTCMYLALNWFEGRYLHSKKMNYTDALTQAHNRKMVDEYMEQNPTIKDFTLFYLDLNDFKPVNDIHGHEAGDKLLKAFVERVRHNFTAGTLVARMGGDEFVIVLEGDFQEQAREGIIQRIENLSKRPFNLDGLIVNISSSIGFAQYPHEGATIEELLNKADERMYAWKKRIKAERAAGAVQNSR